VNFDECSYTLGDEAGVKLRVARQKDKNGMDSNIKLGAETFAVGAKLQRSLSNLSTIFVAGRFEPGSPAFEAGIFRRTSAHSTLGLSLDLSLSQGAAIKLRLTRLGQTVSLPITYATELTVPNVAVGVVGPVVFCSLLRALVLKPAKRRRHKRRLEKLREESAASTETARRCAANDVRMMQAAVERKRDVEIQRRGLVILSAKYGVWEGAMPGDVAGGDMRIIDAAVPLQFLVESSKLQLFNTPKNGLPGFYDVAVGEKKRLYVLYRFKEILHEVVIDGDDPVVIPLKHHALPAGAERSW